ARARLRPPLRLRLARPAPGVDPHGARALDNPAANPLLMLAFQLGMFAFGATVATAPRAFLDRRGPARDARRRVLRFYVPYVAAVYAVGLSVPERWRFGAVIPLLLVGYSVVAGLLLNWAVGSHLLTRIGSRPGSGPARRAPWGPP